MVHLLFRDLKPSGFELNSVSALTSELLSLKLASESRESVKFVSMLWHRSVSKWKNRLTVVIVVVLKLRLNLQLVEYEFFP